ncbi:MAG: glyoxalase [Planctomycetota bacterium]|nr:MAG: glyoxalase [Planctomycetota bacterium]
MKSMHFRVARPTQDLEAVIHFYKVGLDFEILGGFEEHSGFSGIMLGHEDSAYHLEFTLKAGEAMSPAPSKENLLVFYLLEDSAFEQALARMKQAGFEPVQSFNPYWDLKVRTFEDPDGYRVVSLVGQ